MSDVDKILANIIVSILGVQHSSVTPDARFQQDLDADSLDASELLMAAEDAFDIEIPDDKAHKMFRVGDLIAYIKEARREV